jgi:hypothetical protein
MSHMGDHPKVASDREKQQCRAGLRRCLPFSFTKVYHTPQDEMKPEWDFSGFVLLARFTLDVARAVADADRLPTWNRGDEFRSAREKQGVK